MGTNFTGRSDGAGGTAGSGLAGLATSGIKLGSADYNQGATFLLALSRLVSSRLGGPGIVSGGAATLAAFGGSGTTYPACVLFVNDPVSDPWPKITTTSLAIDFTLITAGAAKLYAVVDQVTGGVTALGDGAVNAVSFVAQPAATAAPTGGLLLGSGTVTASAFTAYTETAGVRLDSFRVGTGANNDIYLYANNGDANLPALRYQASGNSWQFSNDGTTWEDLSDITTAMGGFTVAGDSGTPQTITPANTLSLLGGDVTVATVGVATASVTIGTVLAGPVGATAGPGLEKYAGDGYGIGAGLRALLNSGASLNFGTDGGIKVADNGVTLGMLAQLATNKILGRATAGTGDVEAITCTPAGFALLAGATAADQATTLGLGTGNTVNFTKLVLPDSGVGTLKIGPHLSSAGIIHVTSSDSCTALLERAIGNANGPIWQLRKARGSVLSLSDVQNSDEIGAVSFFGYQNADYRAAAAIFGNVDAAPAGNVVQGRLTFYTTTAAGAFTVAAKIDSAQKAWFYGDVALGDAATEVITCTGRLVVRTLAADPTSSATAGNLGEIAFYNGKWYGKHTGTATDTNWSALN